MMNIVAYEKCFSEQSFSVNKDIVKVLNAHKQGIRIKIKTEKY